MKKLEILAQLHDKLGERKIDLIIIPEVVGRFARIDFKKGILL